MLSSGGLHANPAASRRCLPHVGKHAGELQRSPLTPALIVGKEIPNLSPERISRSGQKFETILS